MDNKITLSVLAQMLSERTGASRKECEELLRSFFRTISATLAAGEPVKVRGFGTFKISPVDARMSVDVSSGQDYEIPAHNRIVFIPAKELAGMVNAPFSMFETIELADALTDADLDEAETDTEADEAADAAPEEAPAPADESPTADSENLPQENEPAATEPDQEEQEEPAEEEEASEDEKPAEEDVAPEEVESAEEEESAEEYETPEEVEESPEEDDSTEAPAYESVDPDSHNAAAADEDVSAQMSHSLQPYEISSEEGDDEQVKPAVPQPDHEPRRTPSRFSHGFLWGMVAAILLVLLGCGVLYMLNDTFHSSVGAMIGNTESVKTQPRDSSAAIPGEGEVALAADMAEDETGMADVVEDMPEGKDIPADSTVPTRPSDQPVYDTVTADAGLGVLARRHYGNYHFWPYIYKENEKILGHPDRIRPGTRLVIPPLSKYGVDSRNASDLAKAKRLDAEIYAKYKGK
ncbi:MAG: HU family DNA-binding protein [Muribaculaceae bacterium]|nr:HU family DNA-binding protein [Muribaculaceae bacterium]